MLAVILGGGAGTRLYPLTKQRAKPAVPIGGAYRLIDVPMSNCINSGEREINNRCLLKERVEKERDGENRLFSSNEEKKNSPLFFSSYPFSPSFSPHPPPPKLLTGINKIYVMTQFNSTSLNRHLARTYNVGSGVRFGGDGFVEVLAATQTPTDKEWFQGTADAVRQYAWLFSDTKVRWRGGEREGERERGREGERGRERGRERECEREGERERERECARARERER